MAFWPYLFNQNFGDISLSPYDLVVMGLSPDFYVTYSAPGEVGAPQETVEEVMARLGPEFETNIDGYVEVP